MTTKDDCRETETELRFWVLMKCSGLNTPPACAACVRGGTRLCLSLSLVLVR